MLYDNSWNPWLDRWLWGISPRPGEGNTVEDSNFYELLELRANDEPELLNWLEKSKKDISTMKFKMRFWALWRNKSANGLMQQMNFQHWMKEEKMAKIRCLTVPWFSPFARNNGPTLHYIQLTFLLGWNIFRWNHRCFAKRTISELFDEKMEKRKHHFGYVR